MKKLLLVLSLCVLLAACESGLSPDSGEAADELSGEMEELRDTGPSSNGPSAPPNVTINE